MRHATHLLREERHQRLELADRALVEGKQQLAKPLVRCPKQRVEDGMHELPSQVRSGPTTYKLAKVVDGGPEQGGHGQIVRAVDAVDRTEVFVDVDAGQVEERGAVEVGVLGLDLGPSAPSVRPRRAPCGTRQRRGRRTRGQ